MKRIATLLITVILSNFIYAQKSDCNCNNITDYYQLIYKGQLNYLQENYDSAFVYLKQAEANCPLLGNSWTDEIGMLAEISVRKQDFDGAAEYMEMKMKNGFKFEYFEDDETFQPMFETEQWNQLKQKSDEIYEKWYSNLNLDLRNELIQMLKDDQEVRKQPIDFDEMKRVDSINIQKLKEIFRDYDYPGVNLIGNYMIDHQNADPDTFALHIYGDEQKYFEPLFYEFVKCGKSTYPFLYASLIDSNDRPRGIFTYGVYSNLTDEQIDDFENLNQRRISVGLAPIEVHREIQRLIRLKFEN